MSNDLFYRIQLVIESNDPIPDSLLLETEKNLVNAIETIKELLKYGQHPGECTNIADSDVACELHWEASEKRRQTAIEFLNRFESEKTNKRVEESNQ